MDDIFVFLIDMPTKVHEMVTPCLGGYSVYLNARLSREDQMRAYVHALRHINNDDFEKLDVQEIEAECHENF